MSVLGKNISANLLSNIWLTVLMLILTPLYVHYLGVESYGLIGFYLSWVAILGILDMGISATAVREIAWLTARPDERGKIPSLIRSLEVVYWAIVLTLGAGILTGAWFFGAEWFQSNAISPEVITDALMLMAISLVVQMPSGLYAGGLMGLQRQVECSALLTFFGTVRGVGAVIVLWAISPDIRVFFLWQIVVCALQTGSIRWMLLKGARLEGFPPRFSTQLLHSIKGFAGGMLLITTLSVVISQTDKMVLSRMVSLEMFGFYMLAWTVASGLSRVATPLMQAFGPHFTELVSKGDNKELAKQLRISSQLMSVLILPPTALIVIFSEPILFAWMGNPIVAAGASPILTIMAVGTAFVSCSYPALSILYSKKKLEFVIVVTIVCFVALLPLTMVAITYYGVIGAASIWGIYGLILYIAYETYALNVIDGVGVVSFFLRDFVAPCLASFAVTAMIWFWGHKTEEQINFILLLGFGLLLSCLSTLFICRSLLEMVLTKLKWRSESSV